MVLWATSIRFVGGILREGRISSYLTVALRD